MRGWRVFTVCLAVCLSAAAGAQAKRDGPTRPHVAKPAVAAHHPASSFAPNPAAAKRRVYGAPISTPILRRVIVRKKPGES